MYFYGLYLYDLLLAITEDKNKAIKAAEQATMPATVNLFEIVKSDNRPKIKDNGIIYENKAQQEINNK